MQPVPERPTVARMSSKSLALRAFPAHLLIALALLAPPAMGAETVEEQAAAVKVWNREIVVLRATRAGRGPAQRARRSARALRGMSDSALARGAWPTASRPQMVCIPVRDRWQDRPRAAAGRRRSRVGRDPRRARSPHRGAAAGSDRGPLRAIESAAARQRGHRLADRDADLRRADLGPAARSQLRDVSAGGGVAPIARARIAGGLQPAGPRVPPDPLAGEHAGLDHRHRRQLRLAGAPYSSSSRIPSPGARP